MSLLHQARLTMSDAEERLSDVFFFPRVFFGSMPLPPVSLRYISTRSYFDPQQIYFVFSASL